MKMRLPAVACLVAMLVCAGSGFAADVEKDYESLFGREARAVAATPDTSDDVALAAKMLSTARSAGEMPPLQVLLCEKAYALGMKGPAGWETAAAAAKLLAALCPDRRAECAEKLLAVYQIRYSRSTTRDKPAAAEQLLGQLVVVADGKAAGGATAVAVGMYRRAILLANYAKSARKDEIAGKLKVARARLSAERRLQVYGARLAKDPTDIKTRRDMILLHVVELDDPAAAAGLLNEDVGEVLSTYVPLAARKVRDVSDVACLELAQWYQSLAGRASAAGRPAALRRAKVYYEHYLAVHTERDVPALKAGLELEKVAAALGEAVSLPTPAKTPATTPVAHGEWVDALKLVDVTKHRVAGEAKRLDDGAIHLQPGKGKGTPRVMIPVRPAGSYKFSARFVRQSGDGRVGFILPTGRTAVLLTLSYRGAHGLSRINEKGPNENKAAVRPGKLVNGKEYAVDATVRVQGNQVSIEASLDGKTPIRWQGPQSALDLNPANRLPDPRCMGLAASGPTVFRSVKIRTVEDDTPAPKPSGSGRTVVVKVLPKSWQRFGEVKKGQKLALTAEGTWQDGSNRPPMGPEGMIGGPSRDKRTLCLEARVAGKTYRVGKGRTIVVEKDGWLEMRMMRFDQSAYEKHGSKATGFMTVTIEQK